MKLRISYQYGTLCSIYLILALLEMVNFATFALPFHLSHKCWDMSCENWCLCLCWMANCFANMLHQCTEWLKHWFHKISLFYIGWDLPLKRLVCDTPCHQWKHSDCALILTIQAWGASLLLFSWLMCQTQGLLRCC